MRGATGVSGTPQKYNEYEAFFISKQIAFHNAAWASYAASKPAALDRSGGPAADSD
jgi:hypothetical protein